MLHQLANTEAPAYLHNEQLLVVEYSFSEYKPAYFELSSNKIWLNILFMHPNHEEAVTIRIVRSTLILCQPKEVIEAVVHREIRNFLQQAQVKDYGTAGVSAEAAPLYY